MAKQTVKIIYQTTDGVWHEQIVEESQAQAAMERLRSLPDVKSNTVRMSM